MGKFMSQGEMSGVPHSPDGLYAFPHFAIAKASQYNLGCVFQLDDLGVTMSLRQTKELGSGSIPKGAVGRVQRSTHK